MSDMSATGPMGLSIDFSSRPSRFMGYLGGAMSLALICSGIVWGANVVLRDVSEIPVVRAAQGELRVLPDEPGGDIAQNEGLAVNEVAGAGQVAPVAAAIRLAPEDATLTQDDLADPVAPTELAADVALPEATLLPVSQEDQTNQALASALGLPTPAPAVATVPVATIAATAQRPRLRPVGLQRTATRAPAAVPAPQQAAAGVEVLTADALPAGTPLAQVGAFASPELAAQEWDRLSALYSDYFGTRSRVIQRAVTGGRTFYRLRVRGFADIDDTRRFCSAIKAGGRSDCIAITTR